MAITAISARIITNQYSIALWLLSCIVVGTLPETCSGTASRRSNRTLHSREISSGGFWCKVIKFLLQRCYRGVAILLINKFYFEFPAMPRHELIYQGGAPKALTPKQTENIRIFAPPLTAHSGRSSVHKKWRTR